MLRLLLLCSLVPVLCHSADILATVVSNSYSHFNVMEPLLRTLAERGHRVTVVSSFPRATPLHNYRDIDVSHLLIPMLNNLTFDMIQTMGKDPFSNMKVIWDAGQYMCENVLKSGVLHELYNSSAHYDLVLAHIFAYDCFSVFAHKFDTPVVSVVSSSALPWANPRVGNPEHPAFVINNYVDTDEHMGLYMRVLNTLAWLWSTVGTSQYNYAYNDEAVRKYIDASAPSTEEIVKRTSVVMVNSHFSILQSRPFVPNFVEIGGIHLKDPKPLPKDLQEWLDGATDGVIVFSLGSLVRASSLPAPTITALLQVFRALPQRVLFKFEEALPDAPPNVLVRKWLPQRDVLEHKNVRLLMAHGGQSSTIEAVVSGTPLIGFPLFSDQYSNIRSLVSRGAAELLDIQDINAAQLHQVLNKVLTDPSYKENAAKLSQQFHDRPVSALDTAVYWTEYVLRHKGAPHLRSRSADIPWYQFLLLDVTAALLCLCFSISYVVFVVMRYLYFSVRRICAFTLKCKFE